MKSRFFNIGGALKEMSFPCVMGIINITPNSFYDGGNIKNDSDLIEKVNRYISEGAKILDIGACSTRPGFVAIDSETEKRTLVRAVETIRKTFPHVLISLDTYRSEVAQAGLDAGGNIVNDISGGDMDEKMFDVVAQNHCPYILTHIKGTPKDMQQNPQYKNVVDEVLFSVSKKVSVLKSKGISDIILDVGFGFGKSLEHNYQLLKYLSSFELLGLPILVGVSRKSMIYQLLGTNPEGALNGTTVVHTLALKNGANILRTHDVKEAMEPIRIVEYYKSCERSLPPSNA